MSERKYRWKYLGRTSREGHYLWRDKDFPDRICISDESADECSPFGGKPGKPEDTDDGVLWLDRTRPISGGPAGFAVPVRDENAKASNTFESIAGALYLAHLYGLKIQTEHNLYEIKEARR